MPDPVAVLAPLGPNPAALTELCWALHAQGQPVQAAWVLLESARARHYFERELGRGAWQELRQALPTLPAFPALRVEQATAADSPPAAEAFGQALFALLRQAQREDLPVVVALSGGRWRGSAAMAATVFGLLARPQDRLVDVRLTLREAEGATGFYFPAQERQDLVGRGGQPFRADRVQVQLDPVELPRLRPLLRPEALSDLAAARAAAEAALLAARPIQVQVDLKAQQIRVSGQPLSLPGAALPWIAWMLVDRARGGDGVGRQDVDRLLAFLRWWRTLLGSTSGPGPAGGLASQAVEGRALAPLRADAGPEVGVEEVLAAEKSLAEWASRSRRAWLRALAGRPGRDLLQPTTSGPRRSPRWTVRLPPQGIQVLGEG